MSSVKFLKGRDFSLSHDNRIVSGAHPDSVELLLGALFLRGNDQGHEADHLQ
jgi:hypothetical protein